MTIRDVLLTDVAILVWLDDDTRLDVPCADFPALKEATMMDRSQFRIVDNDSAIEWPDLHLYVGLDELHHFNVRTSTTA